MWRVPRRYVLQVAPVALIIIQMPASGFWESHDNGECFNFAVQLGLLSAWLWLQWPRKKLAYVTFVLAVSVFCLVPALITGINALELGEFRLGASLCECWIAILVSTAVAIGARLILPWRLVDAQSNDDATSEASARGSIFDLIVGVSACAGAFALFQYLLEGEFVRSRPRPIQPAVLAAASTLSAVVFLRLFAPFKIGLQLLVFLLAAPLVAGATWVALTAAGTLADSEADLLANAIALPVCAAIFAMVASLCGLRFGGFELRGLGSHVVYLVINFVCLSIVAGAVIWLNTTPYGTDVDGAPGLMGWPFAQTTAVQSWQLTSLLVNIAIGLAVTFSFGLGTACLIHRFSHRQPHSSGESLPVWHRISTWCALMSVCIMALLGFSVTNVRRLVVDAQLEQRPYSENVRWWRTQYTLHVIDRLTASTARSLGYDVPDEVVTDVVIVKAIDSNHMQEICRLPELKVLELSADVDQLPADAAELLVNSNRLQRLIIECPGLSPSAMNAIARIRSLEVLAVAPPLPDIPVQFGQQVKSLEIDLRENSQLVEFPWRLSELWIKLSDKTNLSGFGDTHGIKSLELNCSQRTIPIELRIDDLNQVVLLHGDSDITMSLRGSNLFDLDFTAIRDPELPSTNHREPNINLEFGGRYGGHQLVFQDSSCFLSTPDPDFNDRVVLQLKETKEVSLAEQLETLSASPKWSLGLSGRMDRAACEQLARLTNLDRLAINCPLQPAGIPLDILETDRFAQLKTLSVSGAAMTQEQFDGLMRAATGLGGIEIDGSRISSIDLQNHPNLSSLVVTNSPGLSEVKFGSELPYVFVVTDEYPDADGYVIKGTGFDRDVLKRIFSEASAARVKVEDERLDRKIWEGLDFGPHLAHLELADFPSSELYESWIFGERYESLVINNQREPPPDLLPALFKNVGRDLLVDMSLDPFPTSVEGHVLSLEGRDVTDEIMTAIEKIESLSELNLRDTGVTRSQVNDLRRRCPWIETIYFDEP